MLLDFIPRILTPFGSDPLPHEKVLEKIGSHIDKLRITISGGGTSYLPTTAQAGMAKGGYLNHLLTHSTRLLDFVITDSWVYNFTMCSEAPIHSTLIKLSLSEVTLYEETL